MKKARHTKKTRRTNRAPSNGTDFGTGQLLAALMAFKRGDFSARLPEDWTGVSGKIADTFNTVIETNERMEQDIRRSREAGFQHHLVKPIDLNKLDSLIQEGAASLLAVGV